MSPGAELIATMSSELEFYAISSKFVALAHRKSLETFNINSKISSFIPILAEDGEIDIICASTLHPDVFVVILYI